MIQQGIGQEVVNVLKLLTHDKESESYEAYIDKICTNPDAMMVKLSNLTDNLDQGTLDVITDRDKERFVIYSNAQCKIMATLATDYPELFKKALTHY